jgi:hypothetical protein
MKYLVLLFACIVLVSGGKLPSYKVDISETRVSGLSAGGFMAVQMHFAFSKYIKAAAVFAGGPYYCAQGQLIKATMNCMMMPNVDVDALLEQADYYEYNGLIDPVAEIKGDKVFLFSGTLDTTVKPGVMTYLETMYRTLGADILTEFNKKANHLWPTIDYGNSCTALMSPYIGRCDYSGSEVSFRHIYPGLKPKTEALSSQLKTFDQGWYKPSGSSMHTTGYIYVPKACENGEETCTVHVSLHGCKQGVTEIQQQWVSKLEINELAEANNIIVVYPQCKKSSFLPSNPNGCWDWVWFIYFIKLILS